MENQEQCMSDGHQIAIVPGQFDLISEFVLGSAVAIPERSLEMAQRLLIDTIAVTAGSSALEVSRIARDHAARFLGTGDEACAARILFDGRAVSLSGAAFAAATQTDNLDAHDGYNPTKGHIGCAVIPALFAFAEQLPDLTGREAVAAVVIAYELAARAGMALHGTVGDYHTSGAWNALGVAALGCRLRGCSQKVLREALGISEYHGPRSQMMREIDNPSMLHDGSGMGAYTGVQAVVLAEDGFLGAPAITIEGENATSYWKDLGEFWTTDLNYIKPYPICRWAHAAIDAVRAVVLREELNYDDIASIRINTFHQAARLFSGMPETTSQAQYSLKFAVAVYLKFGKIGPDQIDGAALRDGAVSDLINRISVSESNLHNDRFPAARWSDAVVVLKDGSEHVSGDIHARGGVESPMNDVEFSEKYAAMTENVMSSEQAKSIWKAGHLLLEPGFKFRELADLCATIKQVDGRISI